MSLRSRIRSAYRLARARKYRYERQVEVRIRADRLWGNLNQFREYCAPVRVAPVLKGNAYGHGLVPVARILDTAMCPFMVVDGYHEALILRTEGVHTPLLVIGHTPTVNIVRCRLRHVSFMVGDLHQIRELAQARSSTCGVHLKVDTGLHRHGVAPGEVPEAVSLIDQAHGLRLEGVYTHIARATAPDGEFVRIQVERWNEVARSLSGRDLHLHVVATAGSAWMDLAESNVARIGLGLYGFETAPGRRLSLKPVLSVHSRIGSLRRVAAGESVGYGLTWTAQRDSILAMVPTGYNACVDRRLSNAGAFVIDGNTCPIVGRVFMNATMIDVSDVPNVARNQPVEIMGINRDAANSAESIASTCGTSIYDVLTGIAPTLRRAVT